jgi:predicted metal-dependent hydrolase
MVQSAATPPPLTGEPLYLRGIELYRSGKFFECHEVLEELWTPTRGPRRLYLQALIHFAVAFYHQQKHNPLGAERQLRKGLRKLERYLPVYEGMDTAALYREGQECLRRILAGERPAPPRMLLQRLPDS